MHMRNFMLTIITAVMILSLSFTSAGAAAPADEGRVVDTILDPEPLYPGQWDTVFDKTPEFRFTQYNDVTKYRITVHNAYDKSVIYYIYKGTATCEEFICRMTPDIALAGGKVTYLDDLKGHYEWGVEAKVGPGLWTGIQEYIEFDLGTAGFNSTFTLDKKNWINIYDDWTLTTKGFLKNTGVFGEYTSVMHRQLIGGDLTYEVRMKLKSDDPDKHYGGLIIEGYPDELDSMQYTWNRGFYVVYNNSQQARVFSRTSGVPVYDTGWQNFSNITPNDWNTIKVVITGLHLEVYINGFFFTDVWAHSLDSSDYAGLTHYRGSTNAETMLVDWAKLEVDTP